MILEGSCAKRVASCVLQVEMPTDPVQWREGEVRSVLYRRCGGIILSDVAPSHLRSKAVRMRTVIVAPGTSS